MVVETKKNQIFEKEILNFTQSETRMKWILRYKIALKFWFLST